MRNLRFLLLPLVASAPASLADINGTEACWTDNRNVTKPDTKPITDNSGTPLAIRDVIQIGFFAGVDKDKDPADYTPADWATFTPLTGDGSLNAEAEISRQSIIGAGLAPPGYFTFGVGFDTTVHTGIPTEDVRLGLRFFDAELVADAVNYNTVSSSDGNWILPAPVPPPALNRAEADMDTADTNGTLVWEGTPFRTDLVPGEQSEPPVLTGLTLSDPTTLVVTWSGGDGTNDIQTSPTGEDDSWTTIKSGVASGESLTIDPATVPTLLVRVVEP